MKAISLWQPWASLWVAGIKRCETRSWPFPAALFGQPIAVHAAKRWTLDQQRAWREIEGALAPLNPQLPDLLPLGKVVGIVIVTRCHRISPRTMPGVVGSPLDFVPAYEAFLGNWTEGRYAWEACSHGEMEPPQPMVGRRGFFDADLGVVNGRCTIENSLPPITEQTELFQ